MLLSVLLHKRYALRRQCSSHRVSLSTLYAATRSPKTTTTSYVKASGVAKRSDFGSLNDLRNLKGIGPKFSEMLSSLDVASVSDLLLHLPRSIIDRSKTLPVSEELAGTIATVELIVEKVREAGANNRGGPYAIRCRDAQNGQKFGLTYFFGNSQYANIQWTTLKRVFTPESRIIVSGKVILSAFSNQLEMVNPDFALSADDRLSISRQLIVEPVYPLTAGLSGTKLRSFIASALEYASENRETYLKEYLPDEFRKQRGWPTLLEALTMAHSPKSEACLSMNSAWKERLAFDEFAALQLKNLETLSIKNSQLAGRRKQHTAAVDDPEAYVIQGNEGTLTTRLLAKLPFELTQCQKNAIADISTDLAARDRMIRCVQGDVGSGKTVVAIMAMLRVVEAGKQAALLAPTEILAKQHFQVIASALDKLREEQHKGSSSSDPRPNVRLITGSVKGKAREELLNELRSGAVDIIVGTHALLSDMVADSIRSLGIVVIDEEQRFGVEQRDALGDRSNVLYTTATPIPRSLMLVVEKSYSISTLVEKPPAKRPVQTLLIGLSYASRVLERIAANIPFGSKVFWVTPCLSPSARLQGSSASERFEQLSAMFPGKVALLHGKMSSEEKEAVMESFAKRDGEISILVSTTVVEVGVDVPDASICVIDRAENFGLSSIHQIRGRVGRGEKPERETLNECFCVLLYQDIAPPGENMEGESMSDDAPLSPAAKLQILAQSNDGFKIAEYDLKLRGPGDIFGLRQHGDAGYKIGCLSSHAHILPDAMDMALSIHENPALYGGLFRVATDIFSSPSLLPRNKPTVAPTTATASATATATATATVAAAVDSAKVSAHEGKGEAISWTLTDAHVLVIDLETTGLSSEKNRIIQIAAKVVGSHRSFNAYITPGQDVPQRITELTGLTQDFLEEEGQPFAEAWEKFQGFLSELRAEDSSKKIVLAAHNGASFDYPFIVAELARSGVLLDWSDRQASNVDALLDTLHVVRDESLWRHLPTSDRPRAFSLSHLFEIIKGRKLENGHNAIVDVGALEHVLESTLIGERWRQVAHKHLFI